MFCMHLPMVRNAFTFAGNTQLAAGFVFATLASKIVQIVS